MLELNTPVPDLILQMNENIAQLLTLGLKLLQISDPKHNPYIVTTRIDNTMLHNHLPYSNYVV